MTVGYNPLNRFSVLFLELTTHNQALVKVGHAPFPGVSVSVKKARSVPRNSSTDCELPFALRKNFLWNLTPETLKLFTEKFRDP